MTSGFAPKYYPRAIIDFANTRGADKIMYVGDFPHGSTLERIFAELPERAFALTSGPSSQGQCPAGLQVEKMAPRYGPAK